MATSTTVHMIVPLALRSASADVELSREALLLCEAALRLAMLSTDSNAFTLATGFRVDEAQQLTDQLTALLSVLDR